MTILNSEDSRCVHKACGTRRGFIYGLTRGTFLMCLAIFGVWLTRKDESACLNVPLCRDCKKFNNCLLPRAEKERRE